MKYAYRYVALLLAIFAITAHADEQGPVNRVLENPVSDGDMIFRVNDGGSKTIPLRIVGATSTVTLLNALAPSSGGSGVANNDAATLTRSGNFALTLTTTGTTGVTLPTTGTLSTLAGSEVLSNKTLTLPIITSISNSGTLTLPTGADTLVGRASTDTLTNKTLTAPTLNAVPTLSLDDSDSAFNLTIASTSTLAAGRTLTLDVDDAARTLRMGGNITVAAAFITSGANSLTLTTSASTNVTLPTTGTLATLAGSETLTNKTISGASNTITNISLTTGVTGTLPSGNGGTGQASNFVQGGVIFGATTTTQGSSAVGTTGQVLLSAAAGTPTWGTDILATTASGNAAAGFKGEYASSFIAPASAVGSGGTGSSTNLTSVALTDGDWEMSGILCAALSATTISNLEVAISIVSGTFPATTASAANTVPTRFQINPNLVANGTDTCITVPPIRYAYTGASDTVYIVGRATFSAGTVNFYGHLAGRRIR